MTSYITAIMEEVNLLNRVNAWRLVTVLHVHMWLTSSYACMTCNQTMYKHDIASNGMRMLEWWQGGT